MKKRIIAALFVLSVGQAGVYLSSLGGTAFTSLEPTSNTLGNVRVENELKEIRLDLADRKKTKTSKAAIGLERKIESLADTLEKSYLKKRRELAVKLDALEAAQAVKSGSPSKQLIATERDLVALDKKIDALLKQADDLFIQLDKLAN